MLRPSVLRFARRPTPAPAKPRTRLRLVKPNAKPRGHWDPAFRVWFVAQAPNMTNADLITAILDTWHRTVSLGTVTNLRRAWGGPGLRGAPAPDSR